jgi:hypothetical protein
MSYTLELELKRLAKKDKDATDFFHRYETMKEYLSREFYPWIQANSPFFTDHGQQHVKSVLETVSFLLSGRLNPKEKGEKLTSLDVFLILSAVLWHDVGMVFGRVDHQERVAAVTEKVKELGFPQPTIHRLVVEISKAHVGRQGLDIPKWEDLCTTANGTYKVYTQALAAIVRFADEISENNSRISMALLHNVPVDNRIYWEYANSIAAARPEPERSRVVLAIEVQKEKIVQKFRCNTFSARTDEMGELSLIEFILCRLEKMNNERAYCAPKFNRYVSIQEIEARFTILDGAERFGNYGVTVVLGDSGLSKTSYPDIQLFEDFFNQYPEWKPQRLKEVLGL